MNQRNARHPCLSTRTRRGVAPIALLLTAALAGACGQHRPARSTTPAPPPVSNTTPQTQRAPAAKHVILIVLENQEATAVLRSVHNGIFPALEDRYAVLTAYRAVAHPSLPNYLALLSGSTQGMSRNCLDCVFTAPSLADTLAAAGLTWKEYVEDLPPRAGDIDKMSIKVRIPFLFFRSVISSPAAIANIEPLIRLDDDIRHGTLPAFSIVVPNLCHAMHDCGILAGDAWLTQFIRPLLNSPAIHDSIIYITFDEATRKDKQGGGGHVATLVLGPLVRRDAESAAPLNHYSLLRAIEDNLNLPYLGQSASAIPITGIWQNDGSWPERVQPPSSSVHGTLDGSRRRLR